ncbi:MAG: acetyl-CoA carboxylase carboxyl transferase subunit beta [Candidatus Marinimicrobia bacterium]|nr:acetyl-CoA carboxylase carboxyl transferase subunit beta [Candidatus Neomarinimicrobiota bacterium]|tara:strand:+ start:6168 stop:7013 length:846 start_codon:yes stop_codon:yes gene_type:complete
MTEWYRRKIAKITTFNKKDIEEGKWQKCSNCGEVLYSGILMQKFYVCSHCNFHLRMPSYLYEKLLLDSLECDQLAEGLKSKNILDFEASKNYTKQIKEAQQKTNEADAVKVYNGAIGGNECVLCIMNFSFIGGSLGSVVGEKIVVGIDYANKNKLPLIIICSSGGARMQEGAISLMQLAKISTKIAQFSKNKGLFISILTDPTTGGVTASYAMQADLIISEPNALIGFAGARVIKQTIGQDLPKGFQRAEFLIKKGFIDAIIPRYELKERLSQMINFFNLK